MMKNHLLLLLVCSLTTSDALRILVVFPSVSNSHNILGQGVVKHLLDAGHEVVYATGIPRTHLPPRLKEIDVSSIKQELIKEDSHTLERFKLKNLIGKPNLGDSSDFMIFVYDMHRRFLEHQNLQDLLNDPKEKFDVVILEWFYSEVLTGIPALFQCPLIWVGSTEAHGSLLRIIDEIPNPAFNPDLFTTSTPPFTFWERGVELWMATKRHWNTNYYITPLERATYNSIYPQIASRRGVSIPPYDKAVYSGSFMFVNSHPSVGTPFRLPQNVKYVAGYHIDEDIKPLPSDLEKLFNESKHGVIYFSMGSNLLNNDMTSEMKASLLELFGKLKQTVLWKFEGELENVPKNVHLVKWAPQQSILAHPMLKFFITHGGQLSTTEAIHFGVPVIGIPLFGDQFVNMKTVQHKGFGMMLQISDKLADDLSVAIKKMLNDPTYTENAQRLSAIYHDRQNSPGDEIVYWTEYVVNTGGALHLRSPALLLPWYQKIYLDYAVLLIAAVLSALFVSKSVLKFIRFISPKKANKNRKNK